MVDYNGSYYAYVHTLQGDIGAIVDNTGTKVVEYGYDAWGKPTKVWSLTHPSESTLTSAYRKLAQLNPFRYRGYVWDEETGLYYLRSRYYDPAWGRFLNSDTYLGKRSGLGSHNVYCYCTNDPVRMFDLNGHEYKISLADLKFDWVGIHILMWYLWGGGEKQTVINSLIWSPYMKNSKLCSTCEEHINDKGLTLSQYTINLLKPYGHELRNGESTTVNLVESVAIQNGEGIIGTNYFHGVNADVGGYVIVANIKRDHNIIQYDITCTWNDIMDPNLKYDSDKKKAEIAENIPYADPQPYEISVTWGDKYTEYIS